MLWSALSGVLSMGCRWGEDVQEKDRNLERVEHIYSWAIKPPSGKFHENMMNGLRYSVDIHMRSLAVSIGGNALPRTLRVTPHAAIRKQTLSRDFDISKNKMSKHRKPTVHGLFRNLRIQGTFKGRVWVRIEPCKGLE
jgi:hypothetical protein